MKKRFKEMLEKMIDEHPWIPIAVGITAIFISWINILLTIGFRLAM